MGTAVKILLAAGIHPVDIASALKVQPVRVRSLLEDREEPVGESRKRAKIRGRGNWKTKTIAAAALLAALGLGYEAISRMLDVSPKEAERIVTSNQGMVAAFRDARRPGKHGEPPRYPASVERRAGPTKEQLWLTRVLFAEAANQSLQVKRAVARVILNRVGHPWYAKDLLGVITQSNQFSSLGGRLWRLSENPESLTGPNRRAYLRCAEIARQATSGRLSDPGIGDAIMFHDDSISCPWSGVERVAKIGRMVFYRAR